jgi:hypothetical protein
MPQRPQLVQFGDLTPAHFAAHPAWIQCHVVDYDEPWHDETDEETFRPWTGPLPAGPEEGILLVAADLTLADGTSLKGFLTPAFPDAGDDPVLLGTIQPQIFLPSGRRESFWDGMFARSAADRARLYAELGRTAERVFPIRFRAKAGLTTGLASGEIAGFYAHDQPSDRPKVVR